MSTLVSLAKENPGRACARSEPGVFCLSWAELDAGRDERRGAWLHAFVDREAVRSSGEPAKTGLQSGSRGAVSRKSILSMRARDSVDAQIPLWDYFLWVGGALLALLFAINFLLPAPLPSKLIESHSTLPPIRITSERKGPEAVVIDTSQLGFLPMLPDKEIAAAPSPPLSSIADAVRPSPCIVEQAWE